jgi:hypothetical protein
MINKVLTREHYIRNNAFVPVRESMPFAPPQTLFTQHVDRRVGESDYGIILVFVHRFSPC